MTAVSVHHNGYHNIEKKIRALKPELIINGEWL